MVRRRCEDAGIGASCPLSLGDGGLGILGAAFPFCSLRRLVEADAAEALVFLGAAITLLVELVLLNVDAGGAVADATVVLGLEAQQGLGQVLPCLRLATLGAAASKHHHSTHDGSEDAMSAQFGGKWCVVGVLRMQSTVA